MWFHLLWWKSNKQNPYTLTQKNQATESNVKFDAVEKAIVCSGIDGTYFANNFGKIHPKKGYKIEKCHFMVYFVP